MRLLGGSWAFVRMVALEPGGTEVEAGELVHWWLVTSVPWHLGRTRPEIPQNASTGSGPRHCSESGVCL